MPVSPLCWAALQGELPWGQVWERWREKEKEGAEVGPPCPARFMAQRLVLAPDSVSAATCPAWFSPGYFPARQSWSIKGGGNRKLTLFGSHCQLGPIPDACNW